MATVFNTVKPITGRVARILNFLETSGDFYIGLGKPTPWGSSYGQGVSDLNPPIPANNLANIPEPIIYKRVQCVAPATRLSVCINDTDPNTTCPNGDPIRFDLNAENNPQVLIQESFNEQSYRLYDPADIQPINGKYLITPEIIYAQGSILGTDYNTVGWRVSALFTQLFLADGVPEGQEIYFPQQVAGGLIQQVTYNTLIERQSNKTHRFEYIITV